jgi:hypothetical protein
MHLHSWAESFTIPVGRATRALGLRVLGSEFVIQRGLPLCALLVLCLRHAVASISV